MKALLALVLLCVLPLAGAQTTAGLNPESEPVSDDFGAPGLPMWATHIPPQSLPGTGNAGEPTLGIPWDTDDVFYKARGYTYRIAFSEGYTPMWEVVDPLFLITDVDPMLHADPDTGRIWTGGLDGACSLMAFSDDNGESWLPTGNMCSGAQFDHQSIGSGPWGGDVKGAVYEHATYYCAQLAGAACATSLDGGVTWEPFTEVLGPCAGSHGHIRVSPVTGFVVVPTGDCGYMYTDNDGLTWSSRSMPFLQGGSVFDPSMAFSRDSGWMWYADATRNGAFVALSKDDGRSWEALGPGPARELVDVGRLHDPPIVAATFADVQAGDDDRVAFSFLGLVDLDGDGTASEYGDMHNDCDANQDKMQWHYYVAMSYDAGESWTVQQASVDPVQLGSIWRGQGNVCRNLLDFNDMDIDSTGRVYIGYSDGCTQACATSPTPGATGYRSREVRVLRQATGLGLFAAHDDPLAPLQPEPEDPPATEPGETADPVTVRLTLAGMGNGTTLDPGPHSLEGRIYGPVPERGGDVEATLDGVSLGNDAVPAHPDGAVWIIHAEIETPGAHVLRVAYTAEGTEQASLVRHIKVVDPGQGEPAQTLPRLEVVSVGPDSVRVRLDRFGEAIDGGWELLVDGEAVEHGEIAALPFQTELALSPGHHALRLQWSFVDAPYDVASVDVPVAKKSPWPGLVIVLAALAVAYRRR